MNNLLYKFDEKFREIPINKEGMEVEVEKMIEEFSKTNDLRLSSKIGVYLRILGRVEEGLIYIKNSHKHNKKGEVSYIIDSIRLMSCYQWLNDFNSAKGIIDDLESMELYNYKDFFLQHCGKVYFEEKNYEKAKEFFVKALEIRKEKGDMELIQSTMGVLMRVEEILEGNNR